MVDVAVRPTSLGELSVVVREAENLWIRGAGTHARIVSVPHAGATILDMTGLQGIDSYSPADLVASVWGGTTLAELQRELALHGQILPIRDTGTVAGSLSSKHLTQSVRWQDVLLGATFVLADGTIAKAGSKAVKSVSGYDVHKLAIGARGTLAVVAQVTVRVSALTHTQVAMSTSLAADRDLTETEQRLMRRAKETFDPTHKLNLGEMGIF